MWWEKILPDYCIIDGVERMIIAFTDNKTVGSYGALLTESVFNERSVRDGFISVGLLDCRQYHDAAVRKSRWICRTLKSEARVKTSLQWRVTGSFVWLISMHETKQFKFNFQVQTSSFYLLIESQTLSDQIFLQLQVKQSKYFLVLF